MAIPQRKRGRPQGSKDLAPRKRKHPGLPETIPTQESELKAISSPQLETPKELNPVETKISLNFVHSGEVLDRKNTIVNNKFAYHVANSIALSEQTDEFDPLTIAHCKRSKDWPKWNEAIKAELDSLMKREVFGPIVQTPKGVKPVGFKWVFVRKRNEKNEIVRYKARLVVQDFSQRPRIDYEETYSLFMDAITFRFLISLTAQAKLDMRLMDVVTAYLYGNLDKDIYMKIPEGFHMPDSKANRPRDVYSVKLQRSLYGLKQSGRMWYNRLSEFLIK